MDKWYTRTTLVGIDAKNIVDSIFCNDRSASSTQTNEWASTGANYYYGAYGRLNYNDTKPTLKCLTNSDKFTVSTSIGNGALTYPVGLITGDEILMAGNGEYTNLTSGIYNPTQSITPSYYGPSPVVSTSNAYGIDSGSNLSSEGYGGFRSVISLSPKVKFSSGDGTYNNPYIVDSN